MGKRTALWEAFLAALIGFASDGSRASAHAADLYADGATGGPNLLAAFVVVGMVAAGFALFRRQATSRRRPSLPQGKRPQEVLVARPSAAKPKPPVMSRGRQGSRARTRRGARRW